MNSSALTRELLAGSVIAVPPLARRDDMSLSPEENGRIIDHLVSGGVTTLLYGGNANLMHVGLSEYPRLIEMLLELAGHDTTVIPSVGPAYGMMLDQARLLRETPFPTAMILPEAAASTPRGVERGVRDFVERLGRPAILYIKRDGYIDVEGAARLVSDGCVALIKYAVVRDNPAEDAFLEELLERVDPALVVSGMGEQPVPEHWRQFGLRAFTSGIVVVAPRLSTRMLRALQRSEFDAADEIRRTFAPLESLRNRIHPVRVLHEAVRLAGIAETGPILPLFADLDETQRDAVRGAVEELRELERNH
jgi:dihydrodipicolinate synthase/N-acetylneuraminate lyase